MSIEPWPAFTAASAVMPVSPGPTTLTRIRGTWPSAAGVRAFAAKRPA